jgi:hypothetical protein
MGVGDCLVLHFLLNPRGTALNSTFQKRPFNGKPWESGVAQLAAGVGGEVVTLDGRKYLALWATRTIEEHVTASRALFIVF